jgi:hypothetical protein
MKALLRAGFVSVDEIDGALVVGFADRQFDTSAYFMLQRRLNPGDDDGVYLEHTDQAHGAYARVSLCAIWRNRIELSVDETAADALEAETTFAVEFSGDRELLSRLRKGLERVFSGTDCRLELNGDA